ncbi:MAG: hypothetical protein WC275_03575 [Bacilli bacterium]
MDVISKYLSRFNFMLFALFITLFIETLWYFFLKKHDKKYLTFVLLMNIILNGLMNFVLIFAKSEEVYLLMLLSFEVFTIIIEAILITFIFKLKFTKVFLFALGANISSYLVGRAFYTFNIIDVSKGPTVWTLVISFYVLIFLCSFLFLARHDDDNNNDNCHDTKNNNTADY